jgi:Holliday junction DNA helicase RuvA
MIAKLEGIISYKDARFIVINVGGVGYKVFVGTDASLPLKEGENASFWTYLAVRENALDLYGFSTKEMLEFFELLIDIPGIGPKSGMSILSVAGIETIKSSVYSGDAAYLTKISGIGKRTAEKIVLELKDKLGVATGETGALLKDESDAMEALRSLGYTDREAREALKKVSKEIAGTSQKVKEALKILGR